MNCYTSSDSIIIILRDVLEEIRLAKFFTVLADEVTASNLEHLAIRVHFVDVHSDIREEFLTFQQLEQITGRHIAEAIIEYLQENGLQVENICGQGYDGASNMSSSRSGVQACIQQVAPLATYVHCSGHCLNLVISHSCKLPKARIVLDRLNHCCRTFLQSPKKNGLLEKVVKDNTTENNNRKALLDVCKTRWAEKHNCYQHFYQAYCFIVNSLEVIGHRMHLDQYGESYSDWDSGARSDAQQLLASITSFDFIVVFLLMYFYLSHLAGVTLKLQGKAVDIITAQQMVCSIQDMYASEPTDINGGFRRIFEQPVRMAECWQSPCKPRSAQKQQNRSNAPAETTEEYYKRNCAIPLLDHIIANLHSRFSPLALKATSLLCLLPSIVCTKEVDLKEVLELYETDLPSPELAQLELTRWKAEYQCLRPGQHPDTLAASIKDCDPDSFPTSAFFSRLHVHCQSRHVNVNAMPVLCDVCVIT